jgi:uncharacterized membrane protein YeaQ/YmgE (transglycosylase-associated protein family)
MNRSPIYFEVAMGVLLWIVAGIVLGALARWVMPGPRAGGLGVAIPLGIGCALVGGLAGTVSGQGSPATIDYARLLFAIIGALFGMLLYRAYAMRAPEAII